MADKLSVITLALAKKFASGLALGGYTQATAINNQVKFTMADGTPVTVTLPIPKDGKSIVDVQVNQTDNHLYCTLSDGSKIDAGSFPSTGIQSVTIEDGHLKYTMNNGVVVDVGALPSGELTEQLKCTETIGSIKSGKIYPIATSFETIIRDMLIKQEAPAITVTLVPTDTLYDVVDDLVAEIGIKTVATKKTNDIKEIEVFINNVSVKKFTAGIASGGTFTYTHTFATPTNDDFTVKVTCKDVENLVTTKTINVKFVGKTYYGYVEPTVGEPTEADVKALQHTTLKDTNKMVYKNITFDYNKVVYAYPKSFGELSSIKDEVNNFTYYPGSFTKQELTVDSIPYILYIQNVASQSAGIELTFK